MAPLAPKKSRRGLIIAIAAIAAVVVLGAAGVAAVVVLNKPPTGEEAVRAYFEKLAAGDADGALTHVVPPTRGSYSDHPLLSNEAISDPDDRPADLVVIERAQTSLGDGATRERVTVTYTVGGTDFRHIVVARQDQEGQPFLLEEPFFEFRVAGGDEGYAIDDVPIEPDPDSPPLAFPGHYTGSVEGNALFAEATAEAAPRSQGQGTAELPVVLEIEFSNDLAPGAEEAVQAAVNAHLDGCLQDHTMDPTTLDPDGVPTSCPFSLGADEVVSVNWSYGRYPDITVLPLGDDRTSVRFETEVNGLVRYDVPPGWVDDEFEFGIAGGATAVDGTIEVRTAYR